jgi:hypothetical protein
LASNPTAQMHSCSNWTLQSQVLPKGRGGGRECTDVFRRYLLHKFPFSVVYLERPDFIEVIAVAHHRRKPGYWSKR